jgi:hypothetical protein
MTMPTIRTLSPPENYAEATFSDDVFDFWDNEVNGYSADLNALASWAAEQATRDLTPWGISGRAPDLSDFEDVDGGAIYRFVTSDVANGPDMDTAFATTLVAKTGNSGDSHTALSIRAGGNVAGLEASIGASDANNQNWTHVGLVTEYGVAKSIVRTVADDVATTFASPMQAGLAAVIDRVDDANPGNAFWALFYYDVGSGGAEITSIAKGASTNLSTGLLSGTTGADAALNISAHNNGVIYVENRMGTSRNVAISFLGFGRIL